MRKLNQIFTKLSSVKRGSSGQQVALNIQLGWWIIKES
jgi:hypothetical protein